MKGWEAKLFLEAQAAIVRVEGMKAENNNRERRGESQAYDEQAFFDYATEIDNIARQMQV